MLGIETVFSELRSGQNSAYRPPGLFSLLLRHGQSTTTKISLCLDVASSSSTPSSLAPPAPFQINPCLHPITSTLPRALLECMSSALQGSLTLWSSFQLTNQSIPNQRGLWYLYWSSIQFCSVNNLLLSPTYYYSFSIMSSKEQYYSPGNVGKRRGSPEENSLSFEGQGGRIVLPPISLLSTSSFPGLLFISRSKHCTQHFFLAHRALVVWHTICAAPFFSE